MEAMADEAERGCWSLKYTQRNCTELETWCPPSPRNQAKLQAQDGCCEEECAVAGAGADLGFNYRSVYRTNESFASFSHRSVSFSHIHRDTYNYIICLEKWTTDHSWSAWESSSLSTTKPWSLFTQRPGNATGQWTSHPLRKNALGCLFLIGRKFVALRERPRQK